MNMKYLYHSLLPLLLSQQENIIFFSFVWPIKEWVKLKNSEFFPFPFQNGYFHFLLLLLLSRFSRVQLCATPQTEAHQAPLSLGFSRQEYWSGLPFPSPMHESESEVAQSCPTLSDPMEWSLPGSSVHGIFQARFFFNCYG